MYESHTKNSQMLKNTHTHTRLRAPHGPFPQVLVWNWHHWYGIHTVGPIIYYTLCANSIPNRVWMGLNLVFWTKMMSFGMELVHKVY